MKRISIGSWAYTIGPYADHPVDFDTVCTRLSELGFDGVELGGFPPHPNPDDMPDAAQRAELVAKMSGWGLSFSGLAANLWSQKLIDTDDPEPYVAEFAKNCQFCERPRHQGHPRRHRAAADGLRARSTTTPRSDRVSTTFNWRCADIAADHGLYVTWEFEPGFAFNKPSDIVRMLDGRPEGQLRRDVRHEPRPHGRRSSARASRARRRRSRAGRSS